MLELLIGIILLAFFTAPEKKPLTKKEQLEYDKLMGNYDKYKS